MANIKTPEEIRILREGGKRLAQVVQAVAAEARPGTAANSLDELAEVLILKAGGLPSFKHFNGYPAATCISVNQVVVHGIPHQSVVLQAGDIVGIDIGLRFQGLYTDMAVTVPVGRVSTEARRLMTVTKHALDRAIRNVKQGNRLGDIGSAVQRYVEVRGYSVVRSLVGHGVGHQVHEEPRIPNFGRPGEGLALQTGMVLAIEPMVNLGTHEVRTKEDGWTIVTADNRLSAHFEHTVAVTDDGATILTT